MSIFIGSYLYILIIKHIVAFGFIVLCQLLQWQRVIIVIRNCKIEFVDTLANGLSFFDEGMLISDVHVCYRVIFEAILEVLCGHEELTGLERVKSSQFF